MQKLDTDANASVLAKRSNIYTQPGGRKLPGFVVPEKRC